MTVPPVNSIDRLKPRSTMKVMAARKKNTLTRLSTSAWRMNGMVRRVRKNSMVITWCGCRGWCVQQGTGSSGLLRFPDLADGDVLETTFAPIPQVGQGTYAHHGREHGREDADGMDDGKAPYRAGAKGKEGNTGNEAGQVGVHDGGPGTVKAQMNGLLGWLAGAEFFPDAFIDQDVGVNGHPQS